MKMPTCALRLLRPSMYESTASLASGAEEADMLLPELLPASFFPPPSRLLEADAARCLSACALTTTLSHG